MAQGFPRSLVPRGFYGRAVLILIVPIVVIQVVLSVVFIQRHYERVTQQLTGNTLAVVASALATITDGSDPQPDTSRAQAMLDTLAIEVRPAASVPASVGQEPRDTLDLAGREVLRVLRADLPGYAGADMVARPGYVLVWVRTGAGVLELAMPRRLVSASNPHQLLVIVFLASVVMAGIAFQFLRLQVRPIRRLGEAAEAYGRGQNMPIKSSGAREIRAASLAFIDMRNRIERQNAQRKIMLSGISHDMRTPLTRMRLILSMMPDDDDITALRTEISDLERLLNGFLDYSRGQAAKAVQPGDLAQISRDIAARYMASGQPVECHAAPVPEIPMDQSLLERALDNLLANALRHGSRALVRVGFQDGAILLSVEDDGPGISPADRARAVEPFVRLDEARNQDSGSGVGLGLAIVSEAARAHGGTLELDQSPDLGGLRATLRLPVP